MKNIHVLPTEKPSRLFVTDGKLFNYHKPQKGDGIKIINQNIYITSDEEIEKDYVIAYGVVIKVMMFDKETLYFVNGTKAKREQCKKIIITTDQDLIKDGVQAIDDDFLEWFVKNPSCESAMFCRFHGINTSIAEVNAISGDGSLNWEGKNDLRDYKIIILKEEPKQEFPQPNIIDNWLEKNGDPEIDKQVEQEAKELCEQETPEKLSPMNDLLIDLRETKISVKESIDIIEDEFMRTQINIFVQKTLDSVIDRIENELLETEYKWQQEQDKNKFSEEDMKQFAWQCVANFLSNKNNAVEQALVEVIADRNNLEFEQFKNK